MILVKSKLGPSKIHGTGLFAEEFIPKGTKIWEFIKGFDLSITKDEFSKLSKPAQDDVLNYAYINKRTGNYILCSDDSRFFNHQENPNVECLYLEDDPNKDVVCFAKRDIEVGEELTCDYREFDANPQDVI